MLTCNNITKSYGIDLILNNVSFKVDKNDRIGIVGKNGSGKSTLFKIITNNLYFDSGEINISKDTSIGYLSQDLNLNEDIRIYDELLSVFQICIDLEGEIYKYQELMSQNIDLNNTMDKYSKLVEEFETLGGYEYQSRIRGIANGLGFSEEELDKKIGELSGGQKTRVALGKLLLSKPQLFLLDEPTNYLDVTAIQWLENYLQSYDGGLMIISHDRYFLDAVVNKIFEIENHKLNEYNGNYSNYVMRKKENLDIQMHHYELQQKEIQRQEEIIDRFRQFNREKSIRKAESREKMLDKMERIEKPIVFQKKARIRFEPQIKSGKTVLEVMNLKKSFSENTLFENIDFTIFRGEKVGIVGANGTGKTTLLNIIAGNLSQDQGEIVLGHNVNVEMYHQEHQGLNPNNSILSEVWASKPAANEGEIRNFLGAFMFTGEDVFKSVGSLSGGETSRISLAKLMLSKSNFLLMDEPTNHLDMETKDILEEALIHYTGTVLLISHDRYFLNRVVDKLLVLENNGIFMYNGNYDYYQKKVNDAKLLEELENQGSSMTKTQMNNIKKLENSQKQKLKTLKKEISTLETKVNELEDQIKEFELLMCKEDFYDDYDKANSITEEYNTTKEVLDVTLEEWTEKQLELELFNNS
ncbi:ATP-binding cassette subfamily F protein 3 [Alkalibaculum bacchi]|uniref:ATP-binding cassette subfamily F protein 3 n=1 Tax=Alkalibaculum bacchi TaxID=645887 RepID=A0A366IF90_9FIRM|nr:ABC-F family ATP-binding cassette domain-containing protein [Alkalibaculum bacchi]RBP70031.1 ATP-binding cassette subfamily F protein 3 [Alkalibaculum bacchi]